MNQDVAIAVLAGGESRRMGRDKASIELGGASLLERISYVANLVAPTVVIGREQPPNFEFDRIPFLEDRNPGLGPIGGLQTALLHFDIPVVLIGCDMPLVDPDSLTWLIDAFEGSQAEHGVATIRNEEVEPLFSVYRHACLALIEDMVSDGQRSLRRLIERGDFGELDAPRSVANRLVNVNTPEELDALRQRTTPHE